MKNKIILMLPFIFFSHLNYAACVQNNNKLTGLVGLDSSSGNIYANLSSTSNECSCSYVRFKETSTDTNKTLSILLAAKMADKKVRVDISDENSCDTGYRVYVQ